MREACSVTRGALTPPLRSILGSTYSFVKTAQPIAVANGRLVDAKAAGTRLHTMSTERFHNHTGALSVGFPNKFFEQLHTIHFPAVGKDGLSTFRIVGFTRTTVNGTTVVRVCLQRTV